MRPTTENQLKEAKKEGEKAQSVAQASHRGSPRWKSLFIAPLIVGIASIGCSQVSEKQLTALPNNPSPVTNNSQAVAKPAGVISNEEATIQMAIIPWQVEGDQETKLQPLKDYLTKATGRSFKFYITKNYNEAVDAVVKGKVELAYLSSSTYIEAHNRDSNVEPLVAPINKLSGRPWYKSIIVVSKASGINKLEELKGKRFAFVDKLSTSAYIVPRVHFMDMGIDPDRDFSQVEFSGSHAKSKAKLIAGEVDAIADDLNSYTEQQKQGTIDPTQLKIIWESSPIPSSPIVASSKVPTTLKNTLKKALVDAPDGLVDPSGAQGVGYTLVQDSDYDITRKLQNRIRAK
jgi:phosphonate transport system substrate-binding protein